jgi:hypothetical protein
VSDSLVPDCFGCVHLIGVNPAGGWMCGAFDRIPVDILSRRVDHARVYPGDGGVRFEAGEPAGPVVRLDSEEFRETEHPRDGDGKFTSGAGGGSTTKGEVTEKKAVDLNWGGAKYTIEVAGGKPISVTWHKNAARGETEDELIWTPNMPDPSPSGSSVLELVRREHPDEFAPPAMPPIDRDNVRNLSDGLLHNAKRELREYREHLLDSGKFNPEIYQETKDVMSLIEGEMESRKEARSAAAIEDRRSAPVGDLGRVSGEDPEFGKVDEKDPLWFISPHGTQPILTAAREAGYTDDSIRNVLGALKQQGWSGKAEKPGEPSEIDKVASGVYGEAEQSLLREIGEREARAPDVADREYYRKGSFRDQPVLSTTRNSSGAGMAVGPGEFVSVGWDEKKTGSDLLRDGYLPFGETFTQGYGEEAETLWVKFPGDHGARGDSRPLKEPPPEPVAKPVRAAGVMYVSDSGHVLLLRRSDTGEWAFPGGHIEPGESAQQAARRECEEEIGHRPEQLRPWTQRVADGVDFTTFMCRVPERFAPRLNDEHREHAWERLGDLEGGSLDKLRLT